MRVLLVLCVLPALALCNRSKRFAALASGIGGAAGCVVTDNVLYANGFKVRPLTTDEEKELSDFQTAVADYKKKMKGILEQRREAMKQKLMGEESNAISDPAVEMQNIEPPKRPSFCSENITTQYYFDGCMVQDNKVYVGKTYARDLSAEEQEQLREFDTKMTAYQKQLQDSLQKQVKGIFGGSDFFSALFGGSPSEESSKTRPSTTSTTPSSGISTTTAAPLSAPEPPQFCYAI